MLTDNSKKKEFVDYLLESLCYGKDKEDKAIINELRAFFNIPKKAELKSYLVENVDFSDLFVKLIKIAEPFAKMMSQIYLFLSDKNHTARALQHILIGENAADRISFDLEAFPKVYQPVIQKIEGYLKVYDLEKVLDTRISPLSMTEGLIGCGQCADVNYQKLPECRLCGPEMTQRFEAVFRKYREMTEIIPPQIKEDYPYEFLCEYAIRAEEGYRGHNYWRECRGYDSWKQTLDEIERRFEEVSNEEFGVIDDEILLRFFELPFWKERNRLYEVWTLVHFLHLLRGVSIELNIKDSQWHLVYSDSREPIAWIRGYHFDVEIWYQYKLKKGLSMFDFPVEPEMLFVYKGKDGKEENIVLMECKERKDYKIREIAKLAAFYRAQAGATINFFFNYHEYDPPVGLKISDDEPLVMLVDNFRPDEPVVSEIEQKFINFMNDKLGIFLQAILVDVSGSMAGKNLFDTYLELEKQLAKLPGSRTLCGTFAERIIFYEPEQLLEKLRKPVTLGGGTQFVKALQEHHEELRKNLPETANINFYVITDGGFGFEDRQRLKEMDHLSLSFPFGITFAANESWLDDDTRRELESFKRFKLLLING